MISPHAVVASDQIGAGVTIHEFAVIRPGVVLGDNVIIHPHVVIESGVEIAAGTEIFPGSYLGKRPHGAGATARPITYERTVVIGGDCAIGPNAVLFYDIVIGDHTLVGDGASIREGCRIGELCVVGRYVTLNYNTLLGSRVKVMDHSWLAGNMRVGNDVFISGGVLTSNDHMIRSREYDEGQLQVPRQGPLQGPLIGDRVIIGVGAQLLPGIVLGEGAVVGAGALVTRDVAPYDLVMGIPARVVRNLRAERDGGGESYGAA
jgi:acetyltransferase-like isoleucine patch superfamily enzyme